MLRQSLSVCRNNITVSELENYYDRLLHSCNCLITLEQLHSSLTTSGFIKQSVHSGARIIIKYSNFKHPESARSLFDDIWHGHGPSSFLWNTMLRAYTNVGHFLRTLELYSLMRKTGIQPNNYTFPFVLKACASESLPLQGKFVHCDVIRTGFGSDMYVEAAMVDLYAKCGLINDGRKVFDKMSKRDLVCWTAMITAYEQAKLAGDALALFNQMQQEGLLMDLVTAVSVASAIGQLGDAKSACSVHGYVARNALLDNVCVGNSIIAMYGKCGEVEKARIIFDHMKERDGITWNCLLSCYTQNGIATEALSIFEQMQVSGNKPNPVTALIVVSACAYLGSRQHGKKIHKFIVDNEIDIDLTLWNAILDMYAKCGDLDTAAEMFSNRSSSELNVSSYNALISGYGMHGFGRTALEIFSRMKEKGIPPNHITFVSIISACSHAGLVHEGRQCFEDMKKFCVTPEEKHFSCMVDMLGRAGLLNEAYELIKTMPSKPNDGIWGALLLACRIHGNTTLGKIAADILFHIEPEHTGYYVLMSNIYAASNKWQEVGNLRREMKDRGLKKPAAFSLIEFHNEVHGFQTGDQLNDCSSEVYKKVESLVVEMKMVGYVPDLYCALHDIEEEDKEHVLKYHSEKLAVAFGLMKIDPGMEIYITKNLRVCNDCHSAFKFISYIYPRKIVVRDVNRFHHFEGGLCSCKDYW